MELKFEDMHRILRMLPKDVVKLMQGNQLFLAGGYIRARIAGEEVSDIDLLSPSKSVAETCANALAGMREAKVYRTRNAFTILCQGRVPVQFIHRWTFDNAADLIASFDFTIAQVAMWLEGGVWKSLASDRFYPDLAARRLTYCFPDRHEDAGGSLLRVQKFIKRGYDISPENLGRVIARLVDRVNPDTKLWEQNEAGKAKVLAGLLRQVDPLTIIDGLEPTDDSLEDDTAGTSNGNPVDEAAF